jgi:hypothetical protein
MEITATTASWKRKPELYLASNNSNNLGLKKYNKLCSKIQYNVIKETKKYNYTNNN